MVLLLKRESKERNGGQGTSDFGLPTSGFRFPLGPSSLMFLIGFRNPLMAKSHPTNERSPGQKVRTSEV